MNVFQSGVFQSGVFQQDSAGGAADYPKRKKRFVVRVGDKLHVFARETDALDALGDDEPASEPQVSRPQVSKPKEVPLETLPIRQVKRRARTVPEARRLFNSEQYAALLEMFEREDEEDILLLM